MVRKFMRYPGGRGKAVTISYDDGVQQDIEMIALMRKYGIKGTFNLNSGGNCTSDAGVKNMTRYRAATAGPFATLAVGN